MTALELKALLDLYHLSSSGMKKAEMLNALNAYFYPKNGFNLSKLNKRRIKVLMVAEKPSMAKELARNLGKRFQNVPSKDLINFT